MILPIVAFVHPVLKKMCKNITSDYENLDLLIYNMWETMYAASGVGLAAPQIGLSIRLFIVDASPFSEDKNLSLEEREKLSKFKMVFINHELKASSDDLNTFNEGCLSIPEIREDVVDRKSVV